MSTARKHAHYCPQCGRVLTARCRGFLLCGGEFVWKYYTPCSSACRSKQAVQDLVKAIEDFKEQMKQPAAIYRLIGRGEEGCDGEVQEETGSS